jgi:hypothetical protein
MNENDLPDAIDEIASHLSRSQEQPPKARDHISSEWSHCAAWIGECRPEVAELLKQGCIREALGVVFAEGMRCGELNAFRDPSRQSLMSEVDGTAPGSKASPALMQSRKRHRDFQTASAVIGELYRRAVMASPKGTPDEWNQNLPPEGEVITLLKKKHGISKDVAKAALPGYWPKGKRGPKPKKPSTR